MALEKPAINGQFDGGSFSVERLFSDFSADDPELLACISHTKRYESGSIVIKKGELPQISLLAEGRARIVHFDVFKRRRILQTIEEREVIGLVETIAGLPFGLSVKTLSLCRFEILKKADFIGLLESRPETCLRLVNLLGSNLNNYYKAISSTTL